jgi:hypothetical protein
MSGLPILSAPWRSLTAWIKFARRSGLTAGDHKKSKSAADGRGFGSVKWSEPCGSLGDFWMARKIGGLMNFPVAMRDAARSSSAGGRTAPGFAHLTAAPAPSPISMSPILDARSRSPGMGARLASAAKPGTSAPERGFGE